MKSMRSRQRAANNTLIPTFSQWGTFTPILSTGSLLGKRHRITAGETWHTNMSSDVKMEYIQCEPGSLSGQPVGLCSVMSLILPPSETSDTILTSHRCVLEVIGCIILIIHLVTSNIITACQHCIRVIRNKCSHILWAGQLFFWQDCLT